MSIEMSASEIEKRLAEVIGSIKVKIISFNVLKKIKKDGAFQNFAKITSSTD